VASFGSGAGSDAFCLRVKAGAPKVTVPTTQEYVKRRKQVSYAEYTRLKGNYKLN
jgi:3-hydroxy-3-methylglutaryl CoA synthase